MVGLYGFLIFGILFSSRQIFVQNLPIDELMSIGGCGMPFSTMVEYQGLFNALIMAYQGGPLALKMAGDLFLTLLSGR